MIQIMTKMYRFLHSNQSGKSNKQLFSAIKVRYAPSPSGSMHIGGLRTALYNYLYAKKYAGQFIIRIEDTDRMRYVQGSIDNIMETLKSLQIISDQSIYIQSQRYPLYKNVQKDLLKKNMAYPCFCSSLHQNNQKIKQSYNGHCRSLSMDEIKHRIKSGYPYAIRIKSDLLQMDHTFMDEVYGQVVMSKFDDFIIVRSDGWPTFHLANVVDDWKMGISHVIRGQQWLTSTSKHIYLYKLFGALPPKFIHLPLLTKKNGKKLAKRDPQCSLDIFLKQQYEKNVLLNFIAQLGWNPNSKIKQSEEQDINKEKNKKNHKGKNIKKQMTILQLSELVQKFNLENISLSPIKVDQNILLALNQQALKNRYKNISQEINQTYFLEKCRYYLPESQKWENEKCLKLIKCVVQRMKVISQLKKFDFFFKIPSYVKNSQNLSDFYKIFGQNAKIWEQQGFNKVIKLKISNIDSIRFVNIKKILNNFQLILTHIIAPQQFRSQTLAMKISEFLVQNKTISNEQLFHLLRYIMTGYISGPSIVQICELMGQNIVIQKIKIFQQAIKSEQQQQSLIMPNQIVQ